MRAAFEVDGITYDREYVTHHLRDLFEVIDNHTCIDRDARPGLCKFDAGTDFRAMFMKEQNLPATAVSDAHRWRPGDPIYIGRPAEVVAHSERTSS